MKGSKKALKTTVTIARDSIGRAVATLKQALERYAPSKQIAENISLATLMFGVFGYTPLSNPSVRLAAVEILAELMLDHLSRNHCHRTLRHAFFTMTVNAGFCFGDSPEVDLAKMQLSARRLLQKLGLEGVCVFDLTPLRKRLPDEPDRRLIFHVHGIVWTRDPDFKFKAAATRLSASRHYTNMLGVRSISFVTRKQSAAAARAAHRVREAAAAKRGETIPAFDDPRFRKLDEFDQTPRSIAFLAYYMLKPVTALKNRGQDTDGKWIVSPDTKGMPLKTALRIAEIYSSISPREAVFGVGVEGGAITREFGKRMDAWERDQRAHAKHLDYHSLVASWRRLLAQYPELDMEPSSIRHREG